MLSLWDERRLWVSTMTTGEIIAALIAGIGLLFLTWKYFLRPVITNTLHGWFKAVEHFFNTNLFLGIGFIIATFIIPFIIIPFCTFYGWGNRTLERWDDEYFTAADKRKWQNNEPPFDEVSLTLEEYEIFEKTGSLVGTRYHLQWVNKEPPFDKLKRWRDGY